MTKILGLDLGTNSIGWAVVDKEGENYQLVDKGVRIFQEGVKIEKGIESSKAAERTGYRSARRLKYRRKLRKVETLKVLIKFGFCPQLTNEELDNWRYKKIYPQNEEFINWWKTDDDNNVNPYYFRNLVVTEKMNLENQQDRYIIGRSFYHICQRRGFLSNRLEGTKESEGAVKMSIAEISKEKGELTLGQYFYNKYIKGEKIRDAYTHRIEHYLEEYDRICSFQELPEEMCNELKKAIFFQRPLKSQKGQIGKCVFEKNKQRCSISYPLFEEYRMLCFINNIKVKTPIDEKLRFLNSEEKEKVLPLFFRKSKEHFDFEDIAKQIAPKKQYCFYKARNKNPEYFQFNYSMKTTVSGCPVSARFISLFGEQFINEKYAYNLTSDGELQKKFQDTWHVLMTFDSEDKLIDYGTDKLGLTEEKLKEFKNIHFKNDFASLSLKAIKKILPFLRDGMIYSHAVFMANLDNVIPESNWKDVATKKEISDEIRYLIANQNEEKQIVEIVNSIIKTCRENSECWSEEAREYFKKDVQKKLNEYYGKNRYAKFDLDKKNKLENTILDKLKIQLNKNNYRGEFLSVQTIDEKLKEIIKDRFKVSSDQLKKVYHPSAIEVYKKPQRDVDGKMYLGSPMVSAVRNPMAMRALHQLRKVVNELIKQEVIDPNTKINIEMARDLMNANERKAYQRWQNDNEKQHKDYADRIKEYYTSHSITTEPNTEDILKYKLWEEQNHKCLYTGNSIALHEFLGANPKYDIEHTIPRSLSFDNSQVNKTLCDNTFNRSVKRNKIPFELSNHSEILARIEAWKEKYENLEKQISIEVRKAKTAFDKDSKDRAIQRRHKLTFEKNYWKEKYNRFIMEDVPSGFKNSQLVDTGIITKYSRMYLHTVFNKVYTVKGNTVADFRTIWGLGNKSRENHIHHCVDAITIACINKENYERLAKYYHDYEDIFLQGIETKPKFEKPWPTFTEDVRNVQNEVFVSHYTADNLPKKNKKKLRKRGIIQKNNKGKVIYQQGDSVRGSLHKETVYGAIERTIVNKKGEEEKQIKYVVRKPLDSLEDSNIKNIVDDKIREIIATARKEEKVLQKQLEKLNKQLSNTAENEENNVRNDINKLQNEIKNLYTLANKNGAPVPIKKVRIYANSVTNPIHLKEHRDKSKKKRKPYKEHIHVTNDGNYAMALYEGRDSKGKVLRDFELISNLEAAQIFTSRNKIDDSIFSPQKVLKETILEIKSVLKIGTNVILFENSSDEVWDCDINELKQRSYKVIGLSEQVIQKKYFYGTIVLRHINESRQSTDLKLFDGSYKVGEDYIGMRKMNHNQLNAIFEGIDFNISHSGKIQQL